MATLRYYHDKRFQKKDGSYPLRIIIQCAGKKIAYTTGVNLRKDQWANGKVSNHTQKTLLNNHLRNVLAIIDNLMLRLELDGRAKRMTQTEILNTIKAEISPAPVTEQKPTFYEWAGRFMDGKDGRTLEIYKTTISKLHKWYSTIQVEDITTLWLQDLERKLATEEDNSVNTISIEMRNIRAIYNYIKQQDESYESLYPFRNYHIKREKTPHRAFTISQLADLYEVGINYPQYRRAVDIFFLMFYLIGINMKDICLLKPGDYDKDEGIVTYRRAKTKRLYNVHVHPEARKLIGRYRSLRGKYLLYVMDDNDKYTKFTRWMNEQLHDIARITGKDATTYYTRHTWSSIAHRLGVQKDIISMGLGHKFGSDTTDIYIDYDSELVQEANEIVIDNFRFFLLLRVMERYFRALSVIFSQFCV